MNYIKNDSIRWFSSAIRRKKDPKHVQERIKAMFVDGQLSLDKLLIQRAQDLQKMAAFIGVARGGNKENLIGYLKENLKLEHASALVVRRKGLLRKLDGVHFDDPEKAQNLLLMNRRELQTMAFKAGIPSNIKRVDIVQKLLSIEADGSAIPSSIDNEQDEKSFHKLSFKDIQDWARKHDIKSICTRQELIERVNRYENGTLEEEFFTTSYFRKQEPEEFRNQSIKELRNQMKQVGLKCQVSRANCIARIQSHRLGTLPESEYKRKESYVRRHEPILQNIQTSKLTFRQLQYLAKDANIRAIDKREELVRRLRSYIEKGGILNTSLIPTSSIST